VNLRTFLELAMDRSKTAQDEPATHRHCHNFGPLDHNAIPSAIPPFRHSTILPFHHSAIPLPFRHSAIQLLPPFHHSVTIQQFRHSAIHQKSILHNG
jgi:hypothetical protein